MRTYNPSGGYAIPPCDPVSKKFIDLTLVLSKMKGIVLEIGAGLGGATLQALMNGVKVFCNDISFLNLIFIKDDYFKSKKINELTDTGDDEQLILLPGAFPKELVCLPKNHFDAILICRVLHFFSGNEIEKSFKQLLMCLKPGGKLFVVCETPFLKNWKKFIPKYEKRVKANIKWPGEIKNPKGYESSGRSSLLPPFVHWITEEVMERFLNEARFEIEYLAYINRKNQFPDDLLLDGRESIGAIAVKPN